MSQRGTRIAMAVVTAIALSLSLSACGNDDEPDKSPSSASSPATTDPGYKNGPVEPNPSGSETSSGTTSTAPPSSTSSPNATDTAPPSVKPENDKALIEAATKFITARENKLSYTREKPSAWIEEAKPYMTAGLYKQLKSQTSDTGSPGAEWNIAHDKKIAVKVNVEQCGVSTASGNDSEIDKTIQCAVTDILVDEKGKPLPSTQIPVNWSQVGAQTPAMLIMTREGGKWLVKMDATGMAS